MADGATDYPWSSAAAHCGLVAAPPECLDSQALHARFTADAWRERLAAPQPRGDVAALRRATRSESALGEPGFVEDLEAKFQVRLRSLPPGPPAKKPVQSEDAPPGIALSAGQRV